MKGGGGEAFILKTQICQHVHKHKHVRVIWFVPPHFERCVRSDHRKPFCEAAHNQSSSLCSCLFLWGCLLSKRPSLDALLIPEASAGTRPGKHSSSMLLVCTETACKQHTVRCMRIEHCWPQICLRDARSAILTSCLRRWNKDAGESLEFLLVVGWAALSLCIAFAFLPDTDFSFLVTVLDSGLSSRAFSARKANRFSPDVLLNTKFLRKKYRHADAGFLS